MTPRRGARFALGGTLLALLALAAGCGSSSREQNYYSYDIDATEGDTCAPAFAARPYLEEAVDPDEGFNLGLGGLENWQVEEGPFVSAVRPDEASLAPSAWTMLRCTYLVTERWDQGFL